MEQKDPNQLQPETGRYENYAGNQPIGKFFEHEDVLSINERLALQKVDKKFFSHDYIIHLN